MAKVLACPFWEIVDRENNERVLIQNEHGFVIRELPCDGWPYTGDSQARDAVLF